jgi:sulfotransferase
MDKRLVCIAGLPRSGSTLIAQLLGHHPDIHSVGHSSPLCGTLENIRVNLSGSDFYLSQLDANFDQAYGRMARGLSGFVDGWFAESACNVVTDKNRGWLRVVPLLEHLGLDYKILVCVRDLGQVFGSIEAQHAKTQLLEFPDNLDAYGPMQRADRLFGRNGIIGSPLHFIQDLQDILTPEIDAKIYYVPFEFMVNNPQASLDELFGWLDLAPKKVNTKKLTVKAHESDSYYRFKYPHATRTVLKPPSIHVIPDRIQTSLKQRFRWYYDRFYPQLVQPPKSPT